MTLDVTLGERGYPIHVGEGLLGRAGDLLAALPSRRAVVVTNATVAERRTKAGRAPPAG